MDNNPYRGPLTNEAAPSHGAGCWTSLLFRAFLFLGVIALGISLLLPTHRTARETGRRTQCGLNLREIAVALRDYEQQHGTLPPAYTVDAQGKPLHSWRTLILPFLQRDELYKSIDLTRPWDDPANAKAAATLLDVYSCPSTNGMTNRTTYLAVVGPNCSFLPSEGRKLADISDSSAETLMVIEVGTEQAVPWMSPIDTSEQQVLNQSAPPKLAHPSLFHGLFVDGGVRILDNELSASDRKALISIAGNDKPRLEAED